VANAVLVHLSGRIGCLLCLLILFCYVGLALRPFEWSPPRRVANGAVRSGETIVFDRPGIARTSSPPPWLRQAANSDEFSLRLAVRTSEAQQAGPARIFTLSADQGVRNLTVAQQDSDLIVRLRTSATTTNGEPELVVPGVFDSQKWREICVLVRPGAVSIELNGETVLSRGIPDRALECWDSGFAIGLGNELTGLRPWLGEIARATVLVESVEHDYLATGAVDIPSKYWLGWKVRLLSPLADFRRDGYMRDAILNWVCFIPLGFIMAQQRGGILAAAFLCAMASGSVEMAQICFQDRSPSILDWALNIAGAVSGGAAGVAAKRLAAVVPSASPCD
jgi:hypothetical protein